MSEIEIRIVERGEVTAKVDADEYAEAKAAGELDMMLDAYASDIDCDVEIVEPDGTCIDYSSGNVFQPSAAADLPVGSVVAQFTSVAYTKRADGLWPVTGGVGAVTNEGIDQLIVDGHAEVLRVGARKDAS